MKQRHFLILAFSLFFVGSLHAQIFWKISGNDLKKSSYLMGTHHIIEKDMIGNFDQILAICGQVDAVVGEMDLSDNAKPSDSMMQIATMNDTTIRDLLSPEDYVFVDTEFKEMLGVGMDQLGRFKPMMLTSIFEITSYLKEYGLTRQPEGIDKLFQNKAVEQKQKIVALETMEEQMHILFGSMTLKRQAELMVEDLKEKKKGVDDLKKLNKYYISGDLAGLETLSISNNNMSAEETKTLIDNRNLNWMKKLPMLMHDQSCFIAVGCLHLVGDAGLLKLLQKAGYTLEPVVF